MRKMPKYNMIFIFLIFMILMVTSVYYYLAYHEKNTINSQSIEEKVTSLGELTTIQYHYKNILLYEDAKQLNGVELPFTTKSFLMMYSGYVKAGVDLENIHIKIDDKKNIIIHLKEAEFQDNVINEEDVVIYDEKSGLFNKLKAKDLFVVLEKEKNKTERELREKGFLKEANIKAEKLLVTLLKEMGFNDIDIHFWTAVHVN